MDFYYQNSVLIQGVIFLALIISSLYGLLHLMIVFIKRVVRRDECRVDKVVVLISVFSFLIFSFMVLPNIIRAKATYFYTSCQINCKCIGTALDMYSHAHNGQYPESLGELTPYYIKEIPKCPHKQEEAPIIYKINLRKKPKDTYSPLYQVYNEPTGKLCRYTFCCAGENHKVIKQGNYPKYNSEQGFFYD